MVQVIFFTIREIEIREDSLPVGGLRSHRTVDICVTITLGIWLRV
jgi:hypothetical protein